jgi:hypothetical protein
VTARSFIVLAASLFLAAPFAFADYTVIGHASDFESRVSLGTAGPTGDYDPSNSITNNNLRIGVAGGSNNKVYANAVVFFKLPLLQGGESITAANFRVTELADPANGPPTINADLWAIGYTNATTPLNGPAESQTYFFNGPLDLNPGVGTGAVRALIQDNFFIPTDVIGTGGAPVSHDTNPTGDTALLDYIQSLYANPNIIPGTTSAILRLNYDDAAYAPVFASVPNHYTIASADSASNRPTLTLTTQLVPEPLMLTFLAPAALLLLSRRREITISA